MEAEDPRACHEKGLEMGSRLRELPSPDGQDVEGKEWFMYNGVELELADDVVRIELSQGTESSNDGRCDTNTTISGS